MKATQLLLCSISCAAVFAAVKASGQTLPAKLNEISPGLYVTGTFDDGAWSGDIFTGVLKFDGFDAFCIEPTATLPPGETVLFQVQDIQLLPNVDTISRLVGAYLASPQTAEHAAAVQWAIWEMTNEQQPLAPSLLDGSTRIFVPGDEPTALLANQYLASAPNFAPVPLIRLTNDVRQDVVSWNVIPEPGSAVLVGGAAVFLLRRRRPAAAV